MNLFCVGISGASLICGVRRHTHVAYRFLTTCLFVGIYVTVFIDPVLGLTSGTGGTRAAMSPYHLVTWVLAVCVYLLPFVVVDRSYFTGRRAGLLRRFVGFALDFHLAAFLVTIPPIALVLARRVADARP